MSTQKKVLLREEALAGARDIIAEVVSEDKYREKKCANFCKESSYNF